MYTANSFSFIFWEPDFFQYRRFKYKTVSLKTSHITYPFWAALILLRSKQRKYYSHEQFTHLNRTASSATVSQALNSPTLSS